MRYLIVLIIMIQISLFSKDVINSYFIKINEDDLNSLYENPYLDTYYQAKIKLENGSYHDCKVRFRGGSSRPLPKKSWKIKFSDLNEEFKVKEFNFNAEYRDSSLMRNYLSMKLFDKMGLIVPEISYCKLYVNNNYMGLFNDVENIDDVFFEKRDIKLSSLYKAIDHGGNFSPIINRTNLLTSWDKKEGQDFNYIDIQRLLNRLYKNFDENDSLEVDFFDDVIFSDQVLSYFAVVSAIVSLDCADKNLFLYFTEDGKAGIVPWDNDATWGNTWEGYFNEYFSQHKWNSAVRVNSLLMILLKNEDLLTRFKDKLLEIVNIKFDEIENIMIANHSFIYEEAVNDTSQVGDEGSFNRSISDLSSFISNRKQYINELNIEVDFLSHSKCYKSEDNQKLIFNISSKKLPANSVNLKLIKNYDQIDFNTGPYIENFVMYDDGLHDDFLEGDNIFGVSIPYENLGDKKYPYFFNTGDYNFPAHGSFYMSILQFPLNSFEKGLEEKLNDLEFIEMKNSGLHYYFKMRNNSNSIINLDLFNITSKSSLFFQFPRGSRISSNETIILSTEVIEQDSYFSDKFFNIPFEFADDDSIYISVLNNSLKKGFSLNDLLSNNNNSAGLVITEINYKSSSSFDCEDWIEIYNNSNELIDLERIRVSNMSNSFFYSFEENSFLEPYSYVIVCKNLVSFNNQYSTEEIDVFEADISLDSEGDDLILVDDFGNLIDFVPYRSTFPWPENSLGTGGTIELLNPNDDNQKGPNWRSSKIMGGTPGEKYLVGDAVNIVINEINYHSNENYNTEDWIEIFNNSCFSRNLNGFYLTDSQDDNIFVFPSGIVLDPKTFFVVCKDSLLFKSKVGNISNFI
ncbi:MAG: CotH kinase family protein [Candidatus Delongbacteria bacterium]|nr:CotH kinase family protein [Candidatus Delongbacteria bacterium]MBN2833569.1 CotH kinase family protein [Candidatus Delongbacteria bacterium]